MFKIYDPRGHGKWRSSIVEVSFLSFEDVQLPNERATYGFRSTVAARCFCSLGRFMTPENPSSKILDFLLMFFPVFPNGGNSLTFFGLGIVNKVCLLLFNFKLVSEILQSENGSLWIIVYWSWLVVVDECTTAFVKCCFETKQQLWWKTHVYDFETIDWLNLTATVGFDRLVLTV